MPSTTVHKDPISWKIFLGSSYLSPLALVCMAIWLHATDALIVATMLPSMVREIGGSGLVAWNVTLYLTTSIVAGTASAVITIRYGFQSPMCLAALVFGLGCVISAIAPSMIVVLFGRAVQGIGGGALVSMGFIAMRVLFPPNVLPRAMAAVSTLWGASALLGPLLGGLFVELSTWRWGFFFFAFQAFVLAIWIACRNVGAPSSSEAKKDSFPLGRLALISVGLLCVAYGGVDVSLLRSGTFFSVGIVCMIFAITTDSRSTESRMLPSSAFDPRTKTGAALLMVLCICIATVTNTVYGTLLLTKAHGVSSLTAGYVLAASAIGWTSAAFVVSGSPEHKDGMLITSGMLTVFGSLIGFAIFYPIGPIKLIALFSYMGGAGFGMAWAFILRKATTDVTDEDAHRVANAITTVQRVGYALGAALIGMVANALGFERLETPEQAGYLARGLFIFCLPIAAVGLLVMPQFVRR